MGKPNIEKGRYALAGKVKGKQLSKPVFGLEKIPAEALLRLALETIGEQESYIEELKKKALAREVEHRKECSAIEKGIKREAIVQIKATQYVQRLERRMAKQKEIMKGLYFSREQLLMEVMRLRRAMEKSSK